MRNQIKKIAEELLIRHGYRGLRFQDIAEKLDITRGNVHYHFGNKEKIAEEVIVDYVRETLAKFHLIWSSKTSTLTEKILSTVELNRNRYNAFNASGKQGQPWSLIARMRIDHDLLALRQWRHLPNSENACTSLCGPA